MTLLPASPSLSLTLARPLVGREKNSPSLVFPFGSALFSLAAFQSFFNDGLPAVLTRGRVYSARSGRQRWGGGGVSGGVLVLCGCQSGRR